MSTSRGSLRKFLQEFPPAGLEQVNCIRYFTVESLCRALTNEVVRKFETSVALFVLGSRELYFPWQ